MKQFLLPEHRCKCGKLLCKGILFTSVVELKCKFCHNINRLYGIEGNIERRVKRFTMLLDVLGGIRIMEISPQASEILGYGREEFLSMTAYEIDPILASGGYDHLWRTRFQDFRKGFRVNSVHRKKNGDLIPVQSVVKFIFSDIKTGAHRENASFTLPDFPALRGTGEESKQMKFPALQEVVRSLWRSIGIRPYAYIIVDCFEGVVEMPIFSQSSLPVASISGDVQTNKRSTHFSFSVDPDGTCIYITPDVVYFLGHTQAEILGNLLFEYIAPKDRKKYHALFLSSIEKRSPFRSTIDFMRKDERPIKLDTCFLPRHDDFGLLDYYEGVCWAQ